LGNDPLSLIFNKEMAALNTYKRLCVARTTRRGAVDRIAKTSGAAMQ
jgi:hypothetical protein